MSFRFLLTLGLITNCWARTRSLEETGALDLEDLALLLTEGALESVIAGFATFLGAAFWRAGLEILETFFAAA